MYTIIHWRDERHDTKYIIHAKYSKLSKELFTYFSSFDNLLYFACIMEMETPRYN